MEVDKEILLCPVNFKNDFNSIFQRVLPFPAFLSKQKTIIKGDSRVCTVNIIWISPDTATWIRNPCKSRKGELALDIVPEKAAVKQRGDAWKIVLDACRPVLHSIDTRHSVSHAIK